jgi:hypothetical protein
VYAYFMTERDVYLRDQGRPQLHPSIVLYADILGSTELARNLEAQKNLEKLDRALKHAKQEGHRSVKAATFSDLIVVGCPYEAEPDSESALGTVILYAAYYQLDLALEGFFVRGAISEGQLFMDDELTFGPALVDAYDAERSRALYPRIILNDSVVAMARNHLKSYSPQSFSPHDDLIA